MMRRRTLPICLLILTALASRAAEVTAIVGVNVVPMDSERVLAGQTVVVADGRIARLGRDEDVAVPPGAQVVQGRGRWLLPGLIDMHVHIRTADLPRYVENGITTVRDLAGLDHVLRDAALVEQGELFGPRILASSMLLTGPHPQNPEFSLPVTRASDAAGVVDQQLARGARSIKVYDELSLAVYDAIVTAAHARGVKVAGHVSRFVAVRHAMVMQDSIEHLSGYPLDDPFDDTPNDKAAMAAASRMSGVWNCPTLYVFTAWVTRDMPEPGRGLFLEQRRALVTALHAAGARLLAGTDAGYLVPAGTSLHEELAELAAAGLTPFEVLSAATRAPAEYLEDASIGVVAEGARADLVLVERNPLEDLSVLRRPSAVMLHGRWISYARRRSARH